MNIIIKTPRFIGDTIMMLSAFELIRLEYPNSKITIVTQSINIDIFRKKRINNFIIDKTKNSNNRLYETFKLIKLIKKEKYDLGFIFHNTLVDTLVFKFSNIKTLIGYNKEYSKYFLDFYLKIDRVRHYINHYTYLVNSFFNNKYSKLPKIELNYENTDLINKNGKKNIAFVLGGNNKGNRTYPNNLSLELFKLFKNNDMNIILLGDNNDNENNLLYESYLKEININVINLSGKTTIAEFIDVIGNVDLLVSIDSSAMHIAAATNTKFITLIGKGTSVFETVKPKVSFGIYLQNDKFDIDDKNLIKNIDVNDIYANIKEIIND